MYIGKKKNHPNRFVSKHKFKIKDQTKNSEKIKVKKREILITNIL